MNNVMNRINALQAQLQDLLAGMSQRDRALFLGLTAFTIIAIVSGSLYMMSSQLSTIESRIDSRQNTLDIVRINLAEYEAAQEMGDTLQEELERHASTDLSAFLDKCAKEVNIEDKINKIDSTSKADDGVLLENRYAVRMSKLTESELANFLYEVETDGFPLQITQIEIQARKRGGELELNVDMSISAYQLSEGAEL
jgi:type II secretory pathway component PulM